MHEPGVVRHQRIDIAEQIDGIFEARPANQIFEPASQGLRCGGDDFLRQRPIARAAQQPDVITPLDAPRSKVSKMPRGPSLGWSELSAGSQGDNSGSGFEPEGLAQSSAGFLVVNEARQGRGAARHVGKARIAVNQPRQSLDVEGPQIG